MRRWLMLSAALLLGAACGKDDEGGDEGDLAIPNEAPVPDSIPAPAGVPWGAEAPVGEWLIEVVDIKSEVPAEEITDSGETREVQGTVITVEGTYVGEAVGGGNGQLAGLNFSVAGESRVTTGDECQLRDGSQDDAYDNALPGGTVTYPACIVTDESPTLLLIDDFGEAMVFSLDRSTEGQPWGG